jgi:plastocyanin
MGIIDFAFQPATLTGRVGQAINLNVTNRGQAPHTFTIQGVTDSGTLNGGASRAVTFTPSAAGTLTYFCLIHGQARMSGTITVTP